MQTGGCTACVFVRTLYASCHTWMGDVHRAHTVCIFCMQRVSGAWISCAVLSHALYVRTPRARVYMCVHRVPPRMCVLWTLCALAVAPYCACAGSAGRRPASCAGPTSHACPWSAVLRLKSYIICLQFWIFKEVSSVCLFLRDFTSDRLLLGRSAFSGQKTRLPQR